MKNKRFALIALMPLLFSCTRVYSSAEHVKEMEVSGDQDFIVLQLTDIHWNYSTNIKEASAYLSNTIKVAKERAGHIDLLEITGDSLLVANKKIATTIYDLIDSWDIPWAFTFGNHDYEGEWSMAWMNNLVSSSRYKNAILPEAINKDDNVDGFSNYVINVKRGGNVDWQIYNIDTHNLVEEAGSYDYDFIHPNQIAWYEQQAELAKTNNSGNYVPSIAFFHIPPTDIYDFEKANDVVGGIKDEKFCPGEHNSDFVKTAKEKGCRGMFFGHDHSNDIVYRKDNMIFGYGVKANTELYSTEKDGISITGCAIYTLHKESNKFDLEHLIIDYDDMEKGASSLTWKEVNL